MKRMIKSAINTCNIPAKPNYEVKSTNYRKYEIHDTYGLPQTGVDIKEFDEWWELEEYLDQNPEVQERIYEGYATIKEI